MANVVKILWSKLTGTVPLSLVDGQIGINQKDRKLFYPDENGVVRTFDMNALPGAIAAVEVTANFGAIGSGNTNTKITVADTRVLTTSKILVFVSGSPTADHSSDEIMLLKINAVASNIVSGVGFDINLYSSHKTYGNIKVNYIIT